VQLRGSLTPRTARMGRSSETLIFGWQGTELPGELSYVLARHDKGILEPQKISCRAIIGRMNPVHMTGFFFNRRT